LNEKWGIDWVCIENVMRVLGLVLILYLSKNRSIGVRGRLLWLETKFKFVTNHKTYLWVDDCCQ